MCDAQRSSVVIQHHGDLKRQKAVDIEAETPKPL